MQRKFGINSLVNKSRNNAFQVYLFVGILREETTEPVNISKASNLHFAAVGPNALITKLSVFLRVFL